jgi:hypothetical protein
MAEMEEYLSRKMSARAHCDTALYAGEEKESLHEGSTGRNDKHNEYADVSKDRVTLF